MFYDLASCGLIHTTMEIVDSTSLPYAPGPPASFLCSIKYSDKFQRNRHGQTYFVQKTCTENLTGTHN